MFVCRNLTEGLNINLFADRKYIVFGSQPEQLLSACRSGKKANAGLVWSMTVFVTGRKYTWLSRPYSNKLPLGNLVLAAAAFFVACSSRLIHAFQQANIACFCGGRPTTYRRPIWCRLLETYGGSARSTSLRPVKGGL